MKDKPQRKGTPIKRTTTQGSSVMGDNDDDGGRRLEKETKPMNRTGNRNNLNLAIVRLIKIEER